MTTSGTTLEGLHDATESLLRSADSLSEERLAEPSLLPGWTRGHVLAHLALNAEGVIRALEGLMAGKPKPVYDSDESRDADIAELAAQDPDQIKRRLHAACDELGVTLARMPDSLMDDSIDRLPGGPQWPVSSQVATRRREVELHHADLGVDYVPGDWPEDFVIELLDVLVMDRQDEKPFRLDATDLGRHWQVGPQAEGAQAADGSEGKVVFGRGHDLGWWLSGRPANELGADPHGLPKLGPWRRAPAVRRR